MSARCSCSVRGWRKILRACLFIAGTLGMAAPAAADTLGDFIAAYKKIEQVAPAGSLPVKSADFEASKGLFDCLAKPGNDTVVCVDNFHDTPLGKKASDGAGIPTTFWQVVDAYIAYKQNDYWGVAYHLGEAAVCAVVQVLLGGVDACSLIKELVELAKAFYDAGKAVVEFLKDVGGTAKDVATCILTLGGDCGDDGPPTPDEQYVYEYVFLPKIADGVTKRELADGSYGAYVTTLVNNAAHKPTPIVSKSWPHGEEGPFGAKTFLYPHFTAKAIETARQMYEKAVDANWSKHVTQQVLPQLGTERFQYRQNQTGAVAQQAAQSYVNKQFAGPDVAVKFLCYQHFTKALPYAHVDQWIASHADAAAKLKVLTHTQWCEQEFWGQKTVFTKNFHDYAKANLCPEIGGSLKCQTLAKYKTCIGLMGSVYQPQQCGLNVQSVGKDVAQEIKNYFASKGSKYPCSVESSANTSAPATLRCARPTQQYHCNKYYQDHFGSKGATPIAVKVLDCALTKNSSYQAQEDKTWNQTVPALVAAHPILKNFTLQKGYDPLVIGVSSELFAELDADAKKFGLDKKVVMSWEPSIDGVDKPTLAMNLGTKLKQSAKDTVPSIGPSKSALGGVNPPDPAGKLAPKMGGMMAKDSAELTTVPAVQGSGQAKEKTGAKPGGAANLTAKPSVPAGGTLGAPGAPTKMLSGDMPSGFGVPSAKPGTGPVQLAPGALLPKPQLAILGVQTKIETNCQSPQPALTATVQIKNSGGPLAASKGTVYIKENGGANLSSAGIHLPAIGAGQIQLVSIPAITLNPYSALPGMHSLAVYLNPLFEGGNYSFNKPALPYMFSANFPSGHCGPTIKQPAPMRSAPSTTPSRTPAR